MSIGTIIWVFKQKFSSTLLDYIYFGGFFALSFFKYFSIEEKSIDRKLVEQKYLMIFMIDRNNILDESFF